MVIFMQDYQYIIDLFLGTTLAHTIHNNEKPLSKTRGTGKET